MTVVYRIWFFSAFAVLVSSFTPNSKLVTSFTAATQRESSLLLQVMSGGDEGEGKKKDIPKEDSDFSDFPIEEKAGAGEYTGSIDWDAEWKKVVANQGQPEQRPGKGYYKSEAELAALRAANQARETAIKATASIPSVPKWNAVKSDWKFWVGVLAAISIATSLLSNAGTSSVLPPTGSSDSYYI